mmetsp:Transcript_28524/g.62088  ORF Transcript_28524/g.62088 Transcript_28524/m.62088 type:complete len:202 (-) Transcript_28524:50-655(-)
MPPMPPGGSPGSPSVAVAAGAATCQCPGTRAAPSLPDWAQLPHSRLRPPAMTSDCFPQQCLEWRSRVVGGRIRNTPAASLLNAAANRSPNCWAPRWSSARSRESRSGFPRSPLPAIPRRASPSPATGTAHWARSCARNSLTPWTEWSHFVSLRSLRHATDGPGRASLARPRSDRHSSQRTEHSSEHGHFPFGSAASSFLVP